MDANDKRRLRDLFLAELRREAAAIEAAAKATREGATHEEAKPENDKDTRAVEASYLAGAQAERARELKEAVMALEALPMRAFAPDAPAALGAVVTLSLDGNESRYLIAPQGGGLSVLFDGVRIQVTTPRAPLGRALVGKTVGDVAEVEAGGAKREYEVLDVG